MKHLQFVIYFCFFLERRNRSHTMPTLFFTPPKRNVKPNTKLPKYEKETYIFIYLYKQSKSTDYSLLRSEVMVLKTPSLVYFRFCLFFWHLFFSVNYWSKISQQFYLLFEEVVTGNEGERGDYMQWSWAGDVAVIVYMVLTTRTSRICKNL